MGQRILVIEDDPILRDFLQNLLSRKGYGVDTVGEGPPAAARVDESNYDLIVSDIEKPFSLDAFERKLERLKHMRQTRRTGRALCVQFI